MTVCRSGGRASKAAEQLTRAGLTAHTMSGGITRWADDGLPVSTPDGHPGRVACRPTTPYVIFAANTLPGREKEQQ